MTVPSSRGSKPEHYFLDTVSPAKEGIGIGFSIETGVGTLKFPVLMGFRPEGFANE
jgi:hypothetical protein